LLGKGSYRATVTITASGTKEHPIIYRAADDSEAVIGGAASAEKRPERGINASDIHDVWFEALSIRNVRWGVVAHRSQRIVMRRCRIYRVEYGFTCTNNKVLTEDFFLADNVLEGPSVWPRTRGIENARGFQVSGRGHVVCYNRISGFADAIDTFGSQECSAIDIYGNEIVDMTDDGIEADYSRHNVRVFNNRLTNCFQGISQQPVFGGPVYIFRNAMYNVQAEPFKMHTAGENLTSGFVLFHNTCVKQGMPWPLWTSNRVNNVVTRNNLFVGTTAAYAMEFTAPMERCNFDYDGFGGGPFGTFAKWNSARYATFGEFASKSPIERHAMLVDPLRLFASGIRPPQDFKRRFSPEENDLRPKPGCGAIDAGQVIPNINDNFVGSAPDLGAYEAWQDLPHYGPRPPAR
ncbi:MAG: right-handed parallel beta-helix repeat-containing protein, partial [Planctomycetes bacterium]|nr:right-handed parallel beta-helix repeat-containing protein [Planctomycetota bacterium]